MSINPVDEKRNSIISLQRRSKHYEEEITKDSLINDLREIGIREGDHLGVSLSFKSIGWVKGGPDAFIDSLLEVVGPNGTIMMNTYTISYPLSTINPNYIFDYRVTPARTGLVPNTLLRRKGSIRSHHPSHSVVAIGKNAVFLTKGHNQNSRPYSPYSRLSEFNGKCLFIGLGKNLVAVRHEAMDNAGLNIVPQFDGVRYRDDEGNFKIFIFSYSRCIKRLPELVPFLTNLRIIRTGTIGKAPTIIAQTKDLIETMTKIVRNDPTLVLCEDIWCLWCRSLERIMNLYGKIGCPKLFQRSVILRNIVALINSFRIKDYRYLSFSSRRIGPLGFRFSFLKKLMKQIKRLNEKF